MTIWMDFIYPYFEAMLEISVMLIFFSKYLRKNVNFAKILPFIALGFIISAVSVPSLYILLLLIIMLILYGTIMLKADIKLCFLYAVLTVEVMQLCYGIFNSVSIILSSFLYHINPTALSYVFMILGSLLALCLSVLCYLTILKYMKHKENAQSQYVMMILIPLLMIFTVSGYINYTFYGNSITIEHTYNLPYRIHFQMLIIQTLGIISIFVILYSYQKLTDRFLISKKLSILEQQSYFQKQYVEEAEAHYKSTTSLRHDMKNHILIIKGLLENGDFEKAKTYIEEMNITASGLSFPFQTGNPVVNILLENKAALAAGNNITLNSSLAIPAKCSISDMDFCIILSNALDNAIHACKKLKPDRDKYINISGHIQEDLFLIEIENTFNGNPHFKYDIGLTNIKLVAEKHSGSVDISADNNTFCLSILLIISKQP